MGKKAISKAKSKANFNFVIQDGKKTIKKAIKKG